MHELNFIWRERWDVLADGRVAVGEEQVCEAPAFPCVLRAGGYRTGGLV